MKNVRRRTAVILVFVCALVTLRAGATDDAAAVMARYLKMSHAEIYGQAQQDRWKTLEELKATPEASVREIIRVLPDLKDPKQRQDLAGALLWFPTKESATKLGELLDDPDEWVRSSASHSLRLLARRVDRTGAQRKQTGEEFPPAVAGLVPLLIKAAGDKTELNRAIALYGLADSLDPAAVAELRRRLKDESAEVRFNAACLLTEFKDASGLAEMKTALVRLRKPAEKDPNAWWYSMFDEEKLLASFERITGQSFGEIPMNPIILSNSERAAASEARYREMLDSWTEWFAAHPDFH